MTDPMWLTWVREIQGLAQIGTHFAGSPYDRERYTLLRALAARIVAAHTGTPAREIEAIFGAEAGYATPKVEVRGVVFDHESRLLMVREIEDHGRWTVPGGWADVNFTPAENVIKEVREESGFQVRVRKLAAVWDRTRQGHPPSMFSCYRMVFICELTGGQATTSLETSEVAWFAEENLPDDLSLGRILPHQLKRMFEHVRHLSLPTDFE